MNHWENANENPDQYRNQAGLVGRSQVQCEPAIQNPIPLEMNIIRDVIGALEDTLEILYDRLAPVRDMRPVDPKTVQCKPIEDGTHGSEMANLLVEYSDRLRRLRATANRIINELEL